jgi:hypothetical protein
MRLIRLLALAVCFGVLTALPSANAQIGIGFSVSIGVEPPPLPVYEQPVIPDPGYMWVPGYWAWSDDVGYYWVPGTWVLPPEAGLLWTPGYWGWNDGAYGFYPGYWGPHIGFYGGVNYGCGYTGDGYEGGYWRGGSFFYNTSVNNISSVSVTNVYTKTVIVNNTSNVSYNGGAGGTAARATPEQVAIAREHHIAATPEQTRHAEAAAKDPSLSLSQNHGHPAVAATPHPGLFKGPGVIAARPGKPIEAKPLKATPAQGNLEEHKLPPSKVNTEESKLPSAKNKAGDHNLPSAKGNPVGTTTGPGSTATEKKPPSGAKLLGRETVRSTSPSVNSAPGSAPKPLRETMKPVSPSPPSAPPPPTTASIKPHSVPAAAPAPRPAGGPPPGRQPPPAAKPKCPPNQQHC